MDLLTAPPTNNTSSSNNNQTVNKEKEKKTISLEEWEKKLDGIQLDKSDLDKLVMNYLVIEGYKEAAEMFSQEAQIQPNIDLNTIGERMHIRHCVQSGQIEEAIEKVNDLDPEILDTNPKLYFHLQQQKLIESIRKGQMMEALQFAQEELAPRGQENPEFLEELEKTISLLAFDQDSPVSYLLDLGQRQKTASELNAAILTSQSQEKDSKLPELLKMLSWTEKKLSEKVHFPKMRDLFTAELETAE